MHEQSNETHNGSAAPLKSEELAAQRTAVVSRTLALAVIAPLVTVLTPWPGPIFIYIILVAFVLLGWLGWWVANTDWGKRWHQYAFVTADFALLTFALLYPNPFVPVEYPPQIALRFGTFVYFFVILAGLAYVYQPRLVLWGGISAAICWAIGVGTLLNLPESVWRSPEDLNIEAILVLFGDPNFIDLGVRVQEVIVFLIVAGLLALAVRRSRMIAVRQARLARERENLGRYFPQKTAQLLAERSDPFSTPREHDCAVLFADLVAFTNWSGKHTPRETIELLQKVHGLLAQIVFRNDGTLDKFIGDGLMATFGTPEPEEYDASNALTAMIEMVEEFEKLNLGGEVGLAVGVHYGPVVIGNLGTEERLEFAVLGDTVNIASRLEAATRSVGCRALASSALIDRAEAESHPDFNENLGKLRSSDAVALKGVAKKTAVFALQ